MGQTRKQNLLFLLSDEHNRNVSGCYGHPLVQTPHLDALAARGTRFTSAYCNSPVCVPSRAALATGRYPHQVPSWDNATPYCGTPESWHAILRDKGVDAVSIGKLHFRGGDDNGFTEEILPLHVLDGVGDLKGLIRTNTAPRPTQASLANNAGPGVSPYCDYDRRIAAAARDWLVARAQGDEDRPFVLFVSFVMPHFPLIAPADFYDLYEGYDLETLSQGLHAPKPDHPSLDLMRQFFDFDSHFDDTSRAKALRAYFGMVTCLDDLIGGVIGALEDAGLSDDTRILYTSDHGDNLGNRGFWGKALMYDDSAAVPMILAGDGVPQNAVVDTPVSLVDVAPTALDCTGTSGGAGFVGDSLIKLANAPADRAILSEYHAGGSAAGQFMVRRGQWKYVYYVDGPPQLFDLAADPGELDDLGDSPDHADIRAQLHADLTAICDPVETSNRALADQAALIERHGGVERVLQWANIPFTPPPI